MACLDEAAIPEDLEICNAGLIDLVICYQIRSVLRDGLVAVGTPQACTTHEACLEVHLRAAKFGPRTPTFYYVSRAKFDRAYFRLSWVVKSILCRRLR
jgi:hypothetical protein